MAFASVCPSPAMRPRATERPDLATQTSGDVAVTAAAEDDNNIGRRQAVRSGRMAMRDATSSRQEGRSALPCVGGRQEEGRRGAPGHRSLPCPDEARGTPPTTKEHRGRTRRSRAGAGWPHRAHSQHRARVWARAPATPRRGRLDRRGAPAMATLDHPGRLQRPGSRSLPAPDRPSVGARRVEGEATWARPGLGARAARAGRSAGAGGGAGGPGGSGGWGGGGPEVRRNRVWHT
jgi:hypothetical protein